MRSLTADDWLQLLDKQILEACVLAGDIKNKQLMSVALRDIKGVRPDGGAGHTGAQGLESAARQARSAAWSAAAALCVCTQTKSTPFLLLLKVVCQGEKSHVNQLPESSL
jgi:hypothetical protein